MNMHYSTFDVVTFAIFLVSLSIFIQKRNPKYLRLFPVYLFFALIVLLRSEWLSNHGRYNSGLVNVWGVVEFCFYFFVLHEIIVNVKAKQVIKYTAVAFALFAFFNLIFIQQKVEFNPVNFTIGCLITVLACIYYFVELFQKTEAQSLSGLPAFWISSGILFNTVLSFPAFAMASFLEESTKVNRANLFIYRNIDSILLIIIILTYILYSIGFVCRIILRKSD
jgi:hypothetical protein